MVVQIGAPSSRHEPEAAHLSRLYGQDQALGYEAVLLDANEEGGEVVARALWPDTALVEYLHRHGMRRLSRRLVSSGALDVVATAVPGMPDVLVLGKLKQMERAAAAGEPDAADFIVLDAPAAGHAVRFLQSPHGACSKRPTGARSASRPQEVVAMLTDPSRCQVLLVTTPEETPVTETIETARLIEGTAGTTISGVIVNGVLPVLDLPPVPAPRRTGAARTKMQGPIELTGTGEPVRGGRYGSAAGVTGCTSGAPGHRAPLGAAGTPFLLQFRTWPNELEQLTDALVRRPSLGVGRAGQ